MAAIGKLLGDKWPQKFEMTFVLFHIYYTGHTFGFFYN